MEPGLGLNDPYGFFQLEIGHDSIAEHKPFRRYLRCVTFFQMPQALGSLSWSV